MTVDDSLLVSLQQGRAEFLEVVAGVRPELLRYSARMTGSITDGEDVVQDTLAHAYFELSQLKELPALRAWLFRIAHNRALDVLRRYDRRMGESLDENLNVTPSPDSAPDERIARDEAVQMSVSRFLELPPAQRSCVVLKDVLDHTLEEIAALLGLRVPAVKAALHRGRARLHKLAAIREAPAPRPSSPAVARYAALFNARDWDGVRAMLVDDVRLDLVSREKRAGFANVGHYFTNYSKTSDWHLVPAFLDGREVLAVFRDPAAVRPGYFIELSLRDERVAAIRDFRYVPYIGQEAEMVLGKKGEES